MRPVRLVLDGFGSFREPCTVDFTDADYFALVGPTGAGKSTVVDAIVFALYGSVPRWEDRRAVGWALAPTATRGVVSLTFDVGTARHVATRELRRSAQGKVTVKNARLERGSEVLAADGEVTGAVERLLGLTYDHFVRCVILPQGDFARFLHSTAKERQDTLVDLLGIRVYREVAERARAEAAAERQRAEFATRQLSAYGDATEQAEAAAAERVDTLRALAGTVAREVPELVAATGALAAAEAEVRRLSAERGLLAGLRVPDGLDSLVSRQRAAAAAASAAEADLAAAEKGDAAAREALAAAPPRAALERAAEHWDELTGLLGGLPAAEAERSARDGELREVEAAGLAAREALAAARAARDEAHRSESALALRAHLVAGEPCPVCEREVGSVPAGGTAPNLAAADRRVADAERAADRLRRDWQAASSAARDVTARLEACTARIATLRAALAASPVLDALIESVSEPAAPGGPDVGAAVDAALGEVGRVERAARDADRALAAARRARDAAAREVAGADAVLRDARSGLDAARDPLVALGAPAPGRADLAADWLALAEWALVAAEERHALVGAATGARAAAAAELAAAEDDLRAQLTAAGVDADPRRPLAEAAEPAVAAAASAARSAVARVAERRAEAATLTATAREAAEAAEVAKLLGQVLRADGFERWLLASALDVLVAEAGRTLLELSGGQFELVHDGRDFAVVDHADADSRRPVRTLSGGETFQASLALALALSSQLAGLSAAGPARLDTIVLDEGFGTLDEATLDVVATTLESLTAGGDRMVGVVTHVGALAERVPVRFAVRRGAAGSTVTREDA